MCVMCWHVCHVLTCVSCVDICVICWQNASYVDIYVTCWQMCHVLTGVSSVDMCVMLSDVSCVDICVICWQMGHMLTDLSSVDICVKCWHMYHMVSNVSCVNMWYLLTCVSCVDMCVMCWHVCHVLTCVSCVDICVICWQNASYVDICVTCWQMCHVLTGLSSVDICAMCWPMCHVLTDVSCVDRRDMCWQMCHVVERYVILHVVDYSSIGSNESLGQVFIELSNLDLGQGCRRTFALADLASSVVILLVVYMLYILCHLIIYVTLYVHYMLCHVMCYAMHVMCLCHSICYIMPIICLCDALSAAAVISLSSPVLRCCFRALLHPVRSAARPSQDIVSASALCPGRVLQLIVQGGGVPWSNTSRQGKPNWWLQQPTSEHAERRAVAPSDPQPHTYVLSATKTATPTLVFSAISDAVTTQQQINKIKKQTLGCIIHGHLWPTEASMM